MLNAGLSDQAAAGLRRATYAGEPLGDDAFVEEMEQRAGRRLCRKKPGPAPKAAAAAAGTVR